MPPPPGAPMAPIPQAALLTSGGALFLGPDDHLRLRSVASVGSLEIELAGRFLDEGSGAPNIFTIQQTPNSDRTVKTTNIPMGVGWLLNAMVRVSTGSPLAGQAYVLLEVIRGFSGGVTPIACLIQGGVTANTRRAWPGSPMVSSAAEPGALRSITGTDPAANVEISETVPTGARWSLLSFFARLVTDATVANREVSLVIDDGTTTCCQIPSGTNHAASLTRDYHFATHGQRNTIAQVAILQAPLPELVLAAGFRIRTVVTNRAAGDNWGAPQIMVEEWLEL